jgi:3-deoxy-manno-octulosonate cytidylyltransferase (CMP-KDO synthetase)
VKREQGEGNVRVKAVAVIPARLQASRLPGKVLIDIHGKPMVQHVYERAMSASRISQVIVACDDPRIAEAVERFGGTARITSPDHASGTDRIAEVARDLDADVVVNVQGDEPMLDPRDIDLAVDGLLEDDAWSMSTLITPITLAEELDDPACVKAVVDPTGRALYFSRSRIPFCRDIRPMVDHPVYKHIGLYAFRRDFLLEYATWPPTPLQIAEGLEQLRVLENGCAIRCVLTPRHSIGVDTETDLERVRELMAACA